MSETHSIDETLEILLKQLSPIQMKKALREVATFLRNQNISNIKQQKNTDGSKYEKRKKKLWHDMKMMTFDYKGTSYYLHPVKETSTYIKGYFPWKDPDDDQAWATFTRSEMSNIKRINKTGSNKKMLTGFGKHIKKKVQTDQLAVGIFGKASRVANVHHAGETEEGIKYPERDLLGFNVGIKQVINTILLKHISPDP